MCWDVQTYLGMFRFFIRLYCFLLFFSSSSSSSMHSKPAVRQHVRSRVCYATVLLTQVISLFLPLVRVNNSQIYPLIFILSLRIYLRASELTNPVHSFWLAKSIGCGMIDVMRCLCECVRFEVNIWLQIFV